MKRYFIPLLLIFLVVGANFRIIRAESNYHPLNVNMQIKFHYIIEHVDKKDSTWQLTVVKNTYPESVTYTWTRPQKDRTDWKGTRILLDLKNSKNFNPWFTNNESKATTDTAPWLSQLVFKELTEKGRSAEFREGGTGALNWARTALAVKEKLLFPVTINGKPEALKALKLNKGIVVWDNPNNPLILEYEPLGVPLVTSVTGWKVVEINY